MFLSKVTLAKSSKLRNVVAEWIIFDARTSDIDVDLKVVGICRVAADDYGVDDGELFRRRSWLPLTSEFNTSRVMLLKVAPPGVAGTASNWTGSNS